jgi:fatty acid desaturase
MHFIMVFTSFIIPQRRNQRARNVTVILIRGGLFLGLLIWFPKAALLYAIAYILMMTVLRFMDSIQHDYPYSATLFEFGKPPRKGDFEWEQEHTFSNPHSLQYEIANWLTLNFGFHNAHHDDMSVPWYRLPAKHREMFGVDPASVVDPGHQRLPRQHRHHVQLVRRDRAGRLPGGQHRRRRGGRAQLDLRVGR